MVVAWCGVGEWERYWLKTQNMHQLSMLTESWSGREGSKGGVMGYKECQRRSDSVSTIGEVSKA